MGAAKPNPGYKRSWKNLLLNKRYQLRFTLFMVGISAVLMAVLGVWVMKEANEATTVAMARVRGEACPRVPEVIEVPALNEEAPPVPMNIDEPAAPPVDPAPVEEKPVENKPAAKADKKKAPEPVVEPPAEEDGPAAPRSAKKNPQA